jgi:Zinc knuckle
MRHCSKPLTIGTNGQQHSITDTTSWIKQLNEPKTSGKEKTPQKKYYFPHRKRDPNTMDVDRLTVDKRNKLMKEGRCFKCRNTGHQANECPEDEDDKKKKAKEEPWKKMNGRELHAHIQALFKNMTEEDRDEFLKGAKEAGF